MEIQNKISQENTMKSGTIEYGEEKVWPSTLMEGSQDEYIEQKIRKNVCIC